MKLAVLALLGSVLFIFTSVSLAQAPDTFWTRIYGGTFTDCGYSVQQTSDGGYIIAGYTECFGAGLADVWLIKADNIGDTLWARTYGGQNIDIGYSADITSDGGFIIAGQTQSFGAGGSDVYLIKTDASGDTLWTKTYGGTGNDIGWSVEQTSDGGYIIAGNTTSFGAGSNDVWLIKTDSNGDTAWTKTYGGADSDGGRSVQQTSDGGYIITGTTWSFGPGEYDIYLIKTDSSGDTLWTRAYGSALYDYGYSVDVTSDSGYIVAGCWQTTVHPYDNKAAYLIKTDTGGDTLWTKIIPFPWPYVTEEAFSVQQTSDDGYIVGGYSDPYYGQSNYALLVKTDSAGDTLWVRRFRLVDQPYQHHAFYSVQQTADGGYVAVGYGRGWDLYFLRGAYFPTIPTLSEWGILIMGLLLLAVGTAAIVRRRRTESRVLN
ncbi:MAG: IPTL-CTERM sorting domain-containing protein [Candidatus Zixiibacteriota bacterium]|nr:MAG: IPTL-CTERM sorting domain-containing protein [candidate division Zixibacteria bacterium]